MNTATLEIPYVDDALVRDAEAVFAASGLTLSDAVRRLMQRTVRDQHVPLDLLKPNGDTLEAMAELDRGEGKRFHNVDDLMADLNTDD